MSYIYSQALVAEYSAGNSLDTDVSARLKTTPTPNLCLWHDKTMAVSRHFRFGMMCEPLTEQNGEALLMWWREDFLVRTSAWQEAGPDWTASGLGYGEKWLGLLAKYDPDTHSLKTAQCSFLEDLTGYLLTLPRSGLMFDGECYQLPMLAHRTSEIGSGYWPTPNTEGYRSDGELAMLAKIAPESYDAMTDRACNSKREKWRIPTPTTQDNAQIAGQYATDGTTLAGYVRMFPTATATATATASKGSSPAALTRKNGKSREFDRLDHYVQANSENGRLNPDWVEWLMGWPIGQTALKPLGTDKYQEWLQQHGEC